MLFCDRITIYMISKEEVQHIAKLARLELSEKEIEKMQADLTEILGYFDLLKNVPPLHPVIRQGAPSNDGASLRNDVVEPRNASIAENIIAASPDKKDGYIKVKTIL